MQASEGISIGARQAAMASLPLSVHLHQHSCRSHRPECLQDSAKAAGTGILHTRNLRGQVAFLVRIQDSSRRWQGGSSKGLRKLVLLIQKPVGFTVAGCTGFGFLSGKSSCGPRQSSLLGSRTKSPMMKIKGSAASKRAVIILSSEGLLGFSAEQATGDHGHPTTY